ncbi:MAG TPA: helix-hairpin-helix domain-containing protein, partial [bacterium]|nr:helix-hairpin-helix domain-containing protein [bacterium]
REYRREKDGTKKAEKKRELIRAVEGHLLALPLNVIYFIVISFFDDAMYVVGRNLALAVIAVFGNVLDYIEKPVSHIFREKISGRLEKIAEPHFAGEAALPSASESAVETEELASFGTKIVEGIVWGMSLIPGANLASAAAKPVLDLINLIGEEHGYIPVKGIYLQNMAEAYNKVTKLERNSWEQVGLKGKKFGAMEFIGDEVFFTYGGRRIEIKIYDKEITEEKLNALRERYNLKSSRHVILLSRQAVEGLKGEFSAVLASLIIHELCEMELLKAGQKDFEAHQGANVLEAAFLSQSGLKENTLEEKLKEDYNRLVLERTGTYSSAETLINEELKRRNIDFFSIGAYRKEIKRLLDMIFRTMNREFLENISASDLTKLLVEWTELKIKEGMDLLETHPGREKELIEGLMQNIYLRGEHGFDIFSLYGDENISGVRTGSTSWRDADAKYRLVFKEKGIEEETPSGKTFARYQTVYIYEGNQIIGQFSRKVGGSMEDFQFEITNDGRIIKKRESGQITLTKGYETKWQERGMDEFIPDVLDEIDTLYHSSGRTFRISHLPQTQAAKLFTELVSAPKERLARETADMSGRMKLQAAFNEKLRSETGKMRGWSRLTRDRRQFLDEFSGWLFNANPDFAEIILKDGMDQDQLNQFLQSLDVLFVLYMHHSFNFVSLFKGGRAYYDGKLEIYFKETEDDGSLTQRISLGTGGRILAGIDKTIKGIDSGTVIDTPGGTGIQEAEFINALLNFRNAVLMGVTEDRVQTDFTVFSGYSKTGSYFANSAPIFIDGKVMIPSSGERAFRTEEPESFGSIGTKIVDGVVWGMSLIPGTNLAAAGTKEVLDLAGIGKRYGYREISGKSEKGLSEALELIESSSETGLDGKLEVMEISKGRLFITCSGRKIEIKLLEKEIREGDLNQFDLRSSKDVILLHGEAVRLLSQRSPPALAALILHELKEMEVLRSGIPLVFSGKRYSVPAEKILGQDEKLGIVMNLGDLLERLRSKPLKAKLIEQYGFSGSAETVFVTIDPEGNISGHAHLAYKKKRAYLDFVKVRDPVRSGTFLQDRVLSRYKSAPSVYSARSPLRSSIQSSGFSVPVRSHFRSLMLRGLEESELIARGQPENLAHMEAEKTEKEFLNNISNSPDLLDNELKLLPSLVAGIQKLMVGKIDINRATAVELTGIPHVGMKLAKRIVAHRDEHGPFESLHQLRSVPYVGPGVAEAIRKAGRSRFEKFMEDVRAVFPAVVLILTFATNISKIVHIPARYRAELSQMTASETIQAEDYQAYGITPPIEPALTPADVQPTEIPTEIQPTQTTAEEIRPTEPSAEEIQPSEPADVEEAEAAVIEQLRISNTGDPNTPVRFSEDYRELPFEDRLVTPAQIILHWDGQPGAPAGWNTRITYNGLSGVMERSELLEDGTIRVEERSTNSHFGVDRNGAVQFLPMYEGFVQRSYGAFGYYDAINIEMAGNNFNYSNGISNVPQEELDHTLNLVVELMLQYDIPYDQVVGHYERDTYTDQYGTVHERGKPDPGPAFMEYFRTLLAGRLNERGIDMGQPGAEISGETAAELAPALEIITIPLLTSSPYPGYADSEASPEGGMLFINRGQEYLPIAPEEMPPAEVTQERSRENLLGIIDWFNIEESMRYQPSENYTYCNILAWDLSTALGVPLPRYAPQLNPYTGA